MSLLCGECQQDIGHGDPLYAATRTDLVFFTALSKEIVGRIPKEDRCPHSCASSSGVDIHMASSARNFNGSYTVRDFTRGGFLFSIPEDVAEKYLPWVYSQFRCGECP